MSNTVSCIVVNYNDADTTLELVNSICGFKSIHKIIVVDNNSSDNSVDRLKELANEKVVLLLSSSNGGYGAGNNIGIKYANEIVKSKYCIIANPDIVFSDDVVKNMVSFLEENPTYAIVSPRQKGSDDLAWKETGIIGDQIYNSVLLNKIFRPRYYPRNHYKKEYAPVFAVPGCFLMVRAKAMVDIGMYDEDFFLFEEEKVIGTKMKNAGWKSAIITNCEYIHNHSVSIKKTFSSYAKRKKLVLKSNALYVKKYLKVSKTIQVLISFYHKLLIGECYILSVIRK